VDFPQTYEMALAHVVYGPLNTGKDLGMKNSCTVQLAALP